MALAPDAASAKAAQGLKRPKWDLLGRQDQALWGECKGSGSRPYQVRVDLSQPAFKCSCPSRKFPCKHGLALLLLWARQPDDFAETEAPDWVAEWLAQRMARQEKKAAAPTKAPDADAQQKRQDARLEKVMGGVAELRLWLKDLAGMGLMRVPEQRDRLWADITARMVDAQAPGLAARLRALGDLNYTRPTWQGELLRHLTQLFLLTEAFERLDQLPPAMQEDVRSLIGWTYKQDELKQQQPTVQDEWLVLARTQQLDQDLLVMRHWLQGQRTERFALVIHFTHRSQTADLSLIPGMAFEGDLVFYPGTVPLRALVERRGDRVDAPSPEGFAHWQHADEAFAAQLARQPWADEMPMLVRDLTLVPHGAHWALVDATGTARQVHNDDLWPMLALSGGEPMLFFLLRTPGHWHVLGAWHHETYYPL
ncbi:SWIM zinc finger [Catalinimonas alkaloidigena]|uniref:SWIM zinc finger n=1 Tax=Catalinimonas alkaloidigena TaxID=1075417 RepID=A0A1G8WTY9_9BACT|nr:SWIM zinc finger family protein [Catalinimonas alkaloidigena]SDJ81862.1 SWIM zinc finger [Catalinimonas alkaloidigena]